MNANTETVLHKNLREALASVDEQVARMDTLLRVDETERMVLSMRVGTVRGICRENGLRFNRAWLDRWLEENA